MPDSLQPHGLQHAKLPCPSLFLRACSNSCPLSQWYHPTISSSVIPFFPWPQSFPATGSFPTSQLFASGGQNIGASASFLPKNIHRPLKDQKMNHSTEKETLPMRKKWLTLKLITSQSIISRILVPPATESYSVRVSQQLVLRNEGFDQINWFS